MFLQTSIQVSGKYIHSHNKKGYQKYNIGHNIFSFFKLETIYYFGLTIIGVKCSSLEDNSSVIRSEYCSLYHSRIFYETYTCRCRSISISSESPEVSSLLNSPT